MGGINSKLSELHHENMNVDGNHEETDLMTTEASFNPLDDYDLPQVIETGTVRHNTIEAQYFEFDGMDNIFKGTGGASLNNNSDPKKSNDKNQSAAARKSFLAAVIKSIKDKAKAVDDDPYKNVTLESVGGLESQIKSEQLI